MALDISRLVMAQAQADRAIATLASERDEVVTELAARVLSLPTAALSRAMMLVEIALSEAETARPEGLVAWHDLAARHAVALEIFDEEADALLLLEASPSEEQTEALGALGLRPVQSSVSAFRGIARPSAVAAFVSRHGAGQWRILPEGTPELRARRRAARDKAITPASAAIDTSTGGIEAGGQAAVHHDALDRDALLHDAVPRDIARPQIARPFDADATLPHEDRADLHEGEDRPSRLERDGSGEDEA